MVILYLAIGYFYKYVILDDPRTRDVFIDFFSHFVSGALAFFIIYIIFPNKNFAVVFFYATLFALFYELVEFLFYTEVNKLIHIGDLGWDVRNIMEDLAMNMFGSLMAMLVEYRLIKKKKQYIQ